MPRNGVAGFMYDCAVRASSGCAAPQSAARAAAISSIRHAGVVAHSAALHKPPAMDLALGRVAAGQDVRAGAFVGREVCWRAGFSGKHPPQLEAGSG
jgi:hypothetical protein